MRQIVLLIGLLVTEKSLSAETPYPQLLAATGWVNAGREGIGTGWVVDLDRRWLLTNYHVVGEAKTVEVFFPVVREGRTISERAWYLAEQKPLLESGERVPGKVLRREAKSDLALIELERLPASVRSLKIAERLGEPGEAVFSVGNRQDSEALWNLHSGSIRQRGLLGEGYFWRGEKLAEGVPALVLQLPIHTGDSGSAVVNRKGELLGILSGIRWQANGSAIAIQSREIRRFLKQPEKEPANRSTTVYAKLASSTVWVRPTATNQRAAGVIVSLERKLILTTLQAVGSEELIEIAFPRYRDSELIAEEGPYRDRLGCWIDGSRTMGMVLLRDPVRDLALIEVDDLPKNLEAVRFTEAIPEIGAKIHSVNHPMGIELLWLESQGIIKQRAQIDHLKKEGQDQAIDTLLLQLPSQAGSSGGGISNASGELIGLTLSRESPQQQLGYAVALSEIRTALARPNPLAKPTDSTEWLKRADFALQLNRFHTARVAFEMSDSVAPSNASRFGILRCLVLSSKFDHAEKFLRDWEREHPDHRNLPLAKAMLNRSRNRPEAVLNLLGGKVESAVLLSERGEAYRLLKKFEEARADLEQSLQIDAQQGDAHRFLARLEADQQRFDQALAAYSRSLELQPYHQETIRERSQVWSRKKEWRRAISDLERLLDLEPRDGSGWFELGRNRLLLGDDSKAISDLIAATRVDGKLHFKVRSLLLERADELAPTDEKRASGILKQYLDQRIRFEVNMKAKEELATIAKTLPTIREGERYRWLKGQLTPERE